MNRPVTIEVQYIIPGDGGFEYEGKKWTWQTSVSGLELVGSDRRGIWGVFTNGTVNARIYKSDLLDIWGDDVANQIFNRETYPEKCFAYVLTSDEIVVLRRGEKGYYSVELNIGNLDKRIVVDQLNEALGVSKAHAAAMMVGSLFGWDCPGAHPRNYDANGKPIRTKSKDGRDIR